MEQAFSAITAGKGPAKTPYGGVEVKEMTILYVIVGVLCIGIPAAIIFGRQGKRVDQRTKRPGTDIRPGGRRAEDRATA